MSVTVLDVNSDNHANTKQSSSGLIYKKRVIPESGTLNVQVYPILKA